MKKSNAFMLCLSILWGITALAQEDPSVTVKNVPSQSVLLLKKMSSIETIDKDVKIMFENLTEYLNKKGIKPTGPPMSIYFSEPRAEWPIAVAIPVPDGTIGENGIEFATLPGGKMASLMFIGSYDKLSSAWERLGDWLKKSSYFSAGAAREIYLISAHQVKDSNQFKTELLWPVL